MTETAYISQIKLVLKTIEKYPKFRQTLINFRKNWSYTEFYHEQITIAGKPIADQVIRGLDL